MDMLPVYVVVSDDTPLTGYWSQQYVMGKIIKVLKCDISEIKDLWAREITPLYNAGMFISTRIYYREPENPFSDYNSTGK